MATMVQNPSSALPFSRSTATANFAIPPSQNTAPVLDFDCLFTYDIRRKAKRWQDGSLRFHTFNHRVMVYDLERNVVGDTHHRNGVQNGDEFTLEKSGALVQVGEQVGATHTDLTELLRKRTRQDGNQTKTDPALQGSDANIMAPRPGSVALNIQRQHAPQESPYSVRQRKIEFERQAEERRQLSRPQINDEHTPLWQVLRRTTATTTKPHAATRSPLAPVTSELNTKSKSKSSSKTKTKNPPLTDSQLRLNVKELIEIPSDSDPSQVDIAGQYPQQNPQIQHELDENQDTSRALGWFTKSNRTRDASVSKNPPMTRPKPPTTRQPANPAPPQPAPETPKRPVSRRRPPQSPSPPSSPPVSTKNRIVQQPNHPKHAPTIDLTAPRHTSTEKTGSLHENQLIKQLRLPAQAPRPMLFCQAASTSNTSHVQPKKPVQRPPSPPHPPAVTAAPAKATTDPPISTADFADLSDEDEAASSPIPPARTKSNQPTSLQTLQPSDPPRPRPPQAQVQVPVQEPPDYSHLDSILLAPAPADPKDQARLQHSAQPKAHTVTHAPTPAHPPLEPTHHQPPAQNKDQQQQEEVQVPSSIPPAAEPPQRQPPQQQPPTISLFQPRRVPPARVASLHNPPRACSNSARSLLANGSERERTRSEGGSLVRGQERVSDAREEAQEEQGDERRVVWAEEGAWSIEAWDLFGCVRAKYGNVAGNGNGNGNGTGNG